MGRKSSGRILIGYDLGEDYAQISYYLPAGEDVETLAVVAGSEQYSIPMVLCRRGEANQWLYGREAAKAAKAQEGDLVENLLALARKGEEITVGE